MALPRSVLVAGESLTILIVCLKYVNFDDSNKFSPTLVATDFNCLG